jgi:O-antigen ligase
VRDAVSAASELAPAARARLEPLRVATLLRAALWVLLAGNLVRLPALSSGAREAPLSVNDLAVLLTLAGGALACAGGRALVLDGVARRALAFAGIGALSAVLAIPRFGLSVGEVGFGLAYLIRWLAYFALYVLVVNGLRRRDVPAVLGTLEKVIVVFAAFGVVQAAFLPGFAQLVYPESDVYVDWDPQGHRLVSTFLDPNFAGAFVGIGFLLVLARLSCGERGLAGRLALLLVALLATASRSSMLAVFVGSLVIAATVGVSRRVVRVGALLFLATLPAVPALLEFARTYNKLAIDASALTRVVSWLRALRIVADHPVLGVGFNTYGFVQRLYGGETTRAAFAFSLDGGLLFVTVMTGFVGLAVYLAMIVRMRRNAREVYRDAERPARERAAGVAAVAATVALLVHSVFVNSLFVPYLMEPLWVLWGCAFVLAAAPARERPAAAMVPRAVDGHG